MSDGGDNGYPKTGDDNGASGVSGGEEENTQLVRRTAGYTNYTDSAPFSTLAICKVLHL